MEKLQSIQSNKIVTGYSRSSFKHDVPKDLLNWIILFYDEIAIYIKNCYSNDLNTQIESIQRICELSKNHQQNDNKYLMNTILDSGIYCLHILMIQIKQ